MLIVVGCSLQQSSQYAYDFVISRCRAAFLAPCVNVLLGFWSLAGLSHIEEN